MNAMEAREAPDKSSIRVKHVNRVGCAGMCDIDITLAVDADTMRCVAIIVS